MHNFTVIVRLSSFLLVACFTLLFYVGHAQSASDGPRPEAPDRFGISATVGKSFTPNSEMTFVSLTGISLIDFQRICPDWVEVPDNLRIKAEFSPGIITSPDARAIISAQVLALVYFRSLSTSSFVPFLEFGPGAIYLDHRVDGQDSRFNFLLLGGPGIEFTSGALKNSFAALRYHHISNGGFCSRNKSVDSVTFSVGYYF